MKNVIIIGAGAAGLAAAIGAAESGASVTVFEKNEKAGKKIYITGKGRCNLTNACEPEDFFENVVTNPRFMYSAFYGFTNRDMVAMVEQEGIPTKVERGNRVFPVSDHASDVTKALLARLKKLKVRLLTDTEVRGLLTESDRVTGVMVRGKEGRSSVSADAVIVATGGLSYPTTGSTGDGYYFAESTGHRVTECYPALVPFETKENVSGMQGLALKNVEAVVKNWTQQGLRTAVDVEKYLSEADKRQYEHRRIFQALGFNRNATEEERRIIDRWFGELGFTMDKVLEACSRTAGISNPNINYVNKVLESWYREGAGSGNGKEISTSEIMGYYEMLRQKETAEADERRQEVYSKIPRIREIEEELNGLNAEISKIIISDAIDKKEATNRIKEKMDSLNAEHAFLLTDNGFELDYMDIRYTCPDCKDTGILETGERCRCFGEVTRKKIQLLMEKTDN